MNTNSFANEHRCGRHFHVNLVNLISSSVIKQIVLPFALTVSTVTGCDSDKIAREKLGKQTAELYRIYLNGGRDEARKSIQEANNLVENAKLSQPYQQGQSFTLFLNYARLYALEHNASNNDMAQADLVKARYWALRAEELRGDSPAECNTYLAKFATGDKLITFINKWDKDANNGESPRYLQPP